MHQAYNNMHADHTCWCNFSSLVLMLTENMHTSYNVWSRFFLRLGNFLWFVASEWKLFYLQLGKEKSRSQIENVST